MAALFLRRHNTFAAFITQRDAFKAEIFKGKRNEFSGKDLLAKRKRKRYNNDGKKWTSLLGEDPLLIDAVARKRRKIPSGLTGFIEVRFDVMWLGVPLASYSAEARVEEKLFFAAFCALLFCRMLLLCSWGRSIYFWKRRKHSWARTGRKTLEVERKKIRLRMFRFCKESARLPWLKKKWR